MNFDKFIEGYKNIEIQNKYLKSIILILCITIIFEGVSIIYISTQHRTIIVPAFIDRQFYVAGDKASPEYLEMMTKYAVELIANYTPETVENRVSEFLRFLDIEYYQKISAEFRATIINDSIKYAVSQHFITKKIIQEGNIIELQGIIRQYAKEKEILYGTAKYKIKFDIKNGKYVINYIEFIKQPQAGQPTQQQ